MSTLPDSIVITEVARGNVFGDAIFQRKFQSSPPEDPHHIVGFYRRHSTFTPISYVHYRPFGDICLVGGACTDGRVFSMMDSAEASAIAASGGVYLHLLAYAFDRFKEDFFAFFGHCGDKRAEEVDLQAGFEKTGHDHLLIYQPKPLLDIVRKALIAKAHALGPF